MTVDSYGITIYNGNMKRGANPSKQRTGGDPRKEIKIMKNVHLTNAETAINQFAATLTPLSPTYYNDRYTVARTLNALDSASGHGVAPHIFLGVMIGKGDPGDPGYNWHYLVGWGHKIDVAYDRIRDRLEEAAAAGYSVVEANVKVLVPAPTGAAYRYCGRYIFDEPVLLRELRRLTYGDTSGRGFVGAARQIYYMRNLGQDGNTEAKMLADVEALANIDRTAHAAQMWLSRHYGKRTA